MDLIGVTVPIQEVLVFGITLACLLGILAFLFKTNLGLSLRVTAQDREVANLMGINVSRICLISVAVASALAAIAGAVVAPSLTIEPYMWSHPLVMMFAAVILGGLGSMKGSFIGAFILGYAEVLVVFMVPQGSFIKGSVAMVIMVAILLLRPEGLFGIAFEEERL
jgi:branched-chain amino acid transport system permease protein